MSTIDPLKFLKTATWTSEEQVKAWVQQVEAVDANELLRLLQYLSVGGAKAAPGHTLRVLAFRGLTERFPDKRLFAHFVGALKTADAPLRDAIATLLPMVNSILDHPALCALLRSRDASLRATVASVLGAIGAKTAFEILAEMVLEPGIEARREIVEVLAAIGEHRAVHALRAALAVGTPEEKIHTIDQLAAPRCMARDPAAASEAIATAITDSSEAVSAHAVETLALVAGEDVYFRHAAPFFDSPSVTVVSAAISGLRLFASDRAVEVLRRKLREGPHPVRLGAIAALEAVGTPAVLEPLADALGHAVLVVRLRAAEALARLSAAGRLDLARTVVWLLRSRDSELRRLAVELAQSVPDPAAELWPKLMGYLRDEDWWVRERLSDALVKLAGRSLLPHVLPYLQDPTAVIRLFAVETLLRLKDPDSLGALVRTAAGDQDWWVRERAVETIGALEDPRAVPYLVDLLLRDAEIRIACLEALGRLGPLAAAAAGPHVAALLDAGDRDLRVATLRCLLRLGDPAHADAIAGSLRDPSPTVRGCARDVLERLQARAESSRARASDTLSFLDKLLVAMAQRGCDDLILAPGRQPHVTRHGAVAALAKNVIEPAQLAALLTQRLSPQQARDAREEREVDFSYEIIEHSLRFRVNVFKQLGGLGAVFRLVRGAIPRVEELGLPPVVEQFAALKNGLVLVGGPTGSGKSTTLATLIDRINRESSRHVVTFEDPIEVVHLSQRSLVNQRELGTHTGKLSQALRGTLRQDPDVILVGEMRDLPTISFAVTAAETGHLVLGTIHTASAALTVDRLINAFPPGQHDQVRALVAGSLKAILCQYLLPRRDAPGRCLAVEVMLNNDAVANLIRKGRSYQIPSVIATSRESGMQLMDMELMRLCDAGRISAQDAYLRAVNKKDFEARLEDAEA